MSDNKLRLKPLLRGHIHQVAFFVALGACALLIAKSSNHLTLLASIVFSFGLLLLFGVSATYHRVYWKDKPRALMKRLDHSAIFILIAGTFTPICLLALSEKVGHDLLFIVWSIAVVGTLQSIFWSKAPKYFSAMFYVGMGWLALPYLHDLKQSLGIFSLSLLFLGGVIYTVGAVIYATKKPNLVPAIFGYHELFHLLTIVAATLHFIVVYQLIK